MLEDRLRKRCQFLTKAQKKVAEFFLAQGEDAAFLSISQLAHQVKSSESTVVRFARSIGYRGYLELQKDLQEWIKKKISPAQVLQQATVKGRGQVRKNCELLNMSSCHAGQLPGGQGILAE